MEFKLIIKKLNGTLTANEETAFNTWYKTSKKHRSYFDNVKSNYKSPLTNIDVEKGWKELMTKVEANTPKRNLWKYAVAASVIVALGLTYLFNQSSLIDDGTPVIVNNNIEAGTDKATLTLEDGSIVTLEKGKEYKAENVRSNGEKLIYKNKKQTAPAITYNYLTIPRGGEFFAQLSDGTRVWINSDSKLKYPTQFVEGETRVVELLYGEAYFEVSPSTDHNGASFIVNSADQEIEVLGTEFNIKAYRGDDVTYTTLVEGKVAVSNGLTSRELSPDQQSQIRKNNDQIDVKAIDTYDETSWRFGTFSFKEKSLQEIVKVLSRWYDADIIIEDDEADGIMFNGVLRKDQNLEDILETISNANDLTYEINDKKVILK